MEITKDTAAALVNAGSNWIGARIDDATDREVRADLERRGLIGPNGGLTRKGTVVRSRVLDAMLDEAFGPE